MVEHASKAHAVVLHFGMVQDALHFAHREMIAVVIIHAIRRVKEFAFQDGLVQTVIFEVGLEKAEIHSVRTIMTV